MPKRLARRAIALVAAAAAVLFSPAATAQDQTIVFTNARIIPIDGPEIDSGYLAIRDGKIVGVGGGRGEVPGPVTMFDIGGSVIMPGLVDTHSHIGGIGAADGSGPIQPGVDVTDSINVRSAGFKRALAGGLTTLNIMPGSGHLSSGRTAYVKLRWNDGENPSSITDIQIMDADGDAMGGLKMANGTNSIRTDTGRGWPGTRGRSAYLVRQQFMKAIEHKEKIEKAEGDPDKMPARDLHLETLIEVMSGKRIVHHHTHRHDDIMTVLRLAEEFGFRVVLHHVSEGWVVADEIANYEGVPGPDGKPFGAPCSIILVDSPGGKLEAINLVFKTGAVLEQAGARVSYHTDDWITDSRLFLRMAALGVRAGMSREAALRSLTIEGAHQMDLSDRVGSLTPGKDADFIILDGDPFSVYTKVEQTWVEGSKVFDRSNPDDLLYATGGYGAGHDIQPYFCCYNHIINARATGANASGGN
ncbi:MAG: amidohydrolase family protein [Planctomycetota bacterium]